MRCPWCSADEDRVVDSRTAEEGASIRRRRECLDCGRRYTTFERIEELPFWVVKESGEHEPFDRAKIASGMRAACKNRPVDDHELEKVAMEIEDDLRTFTAEVTTRQIGTAVLDHLKDLDEVAYLRFASVYKDFEDVDDFRREVGLLSGGSEVPRRPETRRGSGVDPETTGED